MGKVHLHTLDPCRVSSYDFFLLGGGEGGEHKSLAHPYVGGSRSGGMPPPPPPLESFVCSKYKRPSDDFLQLAGEEL